MTGPRWITRESSNVSLLEEIFAWAKSGADSTQIKRMADLFASVKFSRMNMPNVQHGGITYTPLIENPAYTLCVFAVPQGKILPYHDHPNQHVLLRVLRGEMKIESCDTHVQQPYIQGKEYSVSRSASEIVVPESKTFIVHPKRNNIHQITAIQDSMFLDLVVPPYSFERDITYFTLKDEMLRAVSERTIGLEMSNCHVDSILVDR